MRSVITLFIILVAIVASSCGSLRKGSKGKGEVYVGDRSRGIEEAIRKNRVEGNGLLISRARIKYRDAENEATFTAVIRINKEGEILASLKSFAGIEVARVIFSEDTFYIIDKLHRTVSYIGFDDFGKKYGLKKEWIMVVLGDSPEIMAEKSTRIRCKDGFYNREKMYNGMRISETIDCNAAKVSEISLAEGMGQVLSTLRFSDYFMVDNIVIPSTVIIDSGVNMFHVEMSIEKAETGWDGDISFVKPGGYELFRIKK